jgi:hypothetical protein
MVEVVYNQRLLPKIPAGALRRAQQAERDVIAGKVILPAAP